MDSKLAYMRLLNNRQQNTHPQAKLWISINPLWKVQEQVSSGPPAGLHSEEQGMPSDKLSDQLPCRLFELQVSKSFPVARSQYVTFCTLKLTFLLVAGDMLYQQSWRKQTKKTPKTPQNYQKSLQSSDPAVLERPEALTFFPIITSEHPSVSQNHLSPRSLSNTALDQGSYQLLQNLSSASKKALCQHT